MNERERILDLVKQGVITSEEALVLLENLAKAKTSQEDQAHPDQSQADRDQPQPQPRSQADDEAALTALNTQIAEVAGSLDAAVAQDKSIAAKITANDEQIIVLDTMEDLDTLTEAKYQERGELKQENQKLQAQREALTAQITDLKTQLADLNRQKRQLTKQRFTDKVLPDDWQDQAKDALNDLGKTMESATGQISSLMKKTMNNVLDNVDWKDVTVKVPGLATEKLTHTFTYLNSQASVLDLKVANGDVTLRTWEQNDIQVDATIKLFGKMPADTPLDAFIDRSRIDVNDDHFVFQVPNRRIQADLVVSLPKRVYDHVTVRLLNGGVQMQGVEGKDFYVKNANGDMNFAGVKATMLETQGVNGSFKVNGGDIHELLIETVNGDIKVHTTPDTQSLQTVNGTVRITLDHDFEKLTASSVNGNVKLAVPQSIALNGDVKTRFGSVKSRMSGLAAPTKSKHVTLDRPGTGEGVVTITTTSGNIQLKDADD
ncbi:daptomycin-sensing surface protein LiaX [Lacticaseibacillus baoqingensis]|uniref:Daptomycin-sensing surface protein LiaX n=1 Tax=Lacticaseibacillus baoqingensis TaxID=2486013 RepID=A0ABW4E622_9LACO|nr:daptomycin-sensing surface protein LiaX [Lacticaseibacillus baoqingensis]